MKHENIIKEINKLHLDKNQLDMCHREYTYGYSQALRDVVSLVKKLNLQNVSNRRELLIAYGEWIHELAGCKDTEKATTLADSYLSNL